jgi:hypothetical protein
MAGPWLLWKSAACVFYSDALLTLTEWTPLFALRGYKYTEIEILILYEVRSESSS